MLAGVIASRRGACDAKGVSSDRPNHEWLSRPRPRASGAREAASLGQPPLTRSRRGRSTRESSAGSAMCSPGQPNRARERQEISDTASIEWLTFHSSVRSNLDVRNAQRHQISRTRGWSAANTNVASHRGTPKRITQVSAFLTFQDYLDERAASNIHPLGTSVLHCDAVQKQSQ